MDNNKSKSLMVDFKSDLARVGNEMANILSDLPLSVSRIYSIIEKPFKTIDDKAIQKIKDRSKEINDKICNFSRQDSQTTRKLMTLQMLHTPDSSYRILRDILAQCERKEQVLTENILKTKKTNLQIKKTQNEITKLKDKLKECEDPIDKELIEIDIQTKQLSIDKKSISVVNSLSYIEAAIKELGFLQDCYEEIKKSKNIPDDWSEEDFEKEEIKAHIRNAFRLCIRDHIVNGRIGMGTIEYVEQFGISPMEAVYYVKEYINASNLKINKYNELKNLKNNNIETSIEDIDNLIPDYNDFHNFLDKMVEKFKDNYKKACNRLGLSEDLISADFINTADRN